MHTPSGTQSMFSSRAAVSSRWREALWNIIDSSLDTHVHLPRRQIVILIREAGRAAFGFDANEGRACLIHVDYILVQTLNPCAVDNPASVENTRPD